PSASGALAPHLPARAPVLDVEPDEIEDRPPPRSRLAPHRAKAMRQEHEREEDGRGHRQERCPPLPAQDALEAAAAVGQCYRGPTLDPEAGEKAAEGRGLREHALVLLGRSREERLLAQGLRAP